MKALVLSLFSAVLSGCVSHTNAPDKEYPLPDNEWQVTRDVIFTPSDWPEPLKADIYVPSSKGPHPAVLTVHGGGWSGRSPDDMDGVAERLAAMGFVVMNLEYRFAPDYRFPAQLHDIQQARRWLNDNAERLAVDTQRVAGWGYSSGAHLVALLALVASDGGELNQPYGGPDTSLAAVVAGGVPSDLRKFGSGKLVEQFLGGTIKELPDAYANASPVTHISDRAPPFFLYHGNLDTLVPTDHTTDFQTALEAHGVTTEMMRLRWRGHILTFLLGGRAEDAGYQFLYRHLID